ncbi:MAG: hypothetical protein FD145_1480 [Candidatus Saganbacteria bacterium]|uniref:L,D-TPase catalytic domain-containing protein n=1 Tax=Candidatus Saganbacteria bacterium TaxID=2575572 RepID=A0A833KZP6_UNCSA|nr:MAG: hypothetical protein FD145_1480 [Candidatus Saganbacteria bacterium]
MRKKITNILLIAVLILGGIGVFKYCENSRLSSSLTYYSRSLLDNKVKEIAEKHSNGDVIVVSKKDHLLYYCRKGLIVNGDKFGGFVYNFPVPVSLGANNNWTPVGNFKVYVKNEKSRFTLFLGFLGLYGIHGADTRLASKLNQLESLNPDLVYVTRKDQTRGCVAVENRVIRYLYANIGVNTPVLIMP